MTTPQAQGKSTTDTRTMALTMFADNVPCIFQMADPSCEKTARWLGFFVHEESAGCGYDEPLLVCEEHRTVIQRASSPFWRTWFATPPWPCGGCGKPVRLDRFEAVG